VGAERRGCCLVVFRYLKLFRIGVIDVYYLLSDLPEEEHLWLRHFFWLSIPIDRF